MYKNTQLPKILFVWNRSQVGDILIPNGLVALVLGPHVWLHLNVPSIPTPIWLAQACMVVLDEQKLHWFYVLMLSWWLA